MKHRADYVSADWFPETKPIPTYSKYVVTVYEVFRMTIEVDGYSPDHARERVSNRMARGEYHTVMPVYDYTLPYEKWMVQDEKGNILS